MENENKIEPEFEQVMSLLQNKYGWDWTTVPDEKKLTADIINDTIKAVKFISSKPMLAAVPDVDKGHGKCVRCKQSWATIDYNGHGHWVCDHCDRMLENEFEDEYR